MKSQGIIHNSRFIIQRPKVFVGLSGGVDSAVSAALLKKEGYEVTGVFIKTWTPEWLECTWKEDRRSAMRAAAVLDIPFITLDLEKEYKEGVADYMISEYKAGRTPNPDVMCNKEIKFGGFLKFALAQGADYVATGHYARRVASPEQGDSPGTTPSRTGVETKSGWGLFEGKDKNKDQSYFLWTLTQAELKHVLFPVGHLPKEEVRKLASKFGLPQATRKDSQGICFLGDIDMKEFLSHYIPSKKGSVLNEKGEVIGEHNGALFFTLGERHGFTITTKSPDSDKLYVVAKDTKKNTITVAPKLHHTKKSQGEPLTLKDINWISGNAPEKKKILCRYRYRQNKMECEINGKVLKIKNLDEAVSSGQSVVFYRGDKCLGGGVIA